jgi:hypothetical protein
MHERHYFGTDRIQAGLPWAMLHAHKSELTEKTELVLQCARSHPDALRKIGQRRPAMLIVARVANQRFE